MATITEQTLCPERLQCRNSDLSLWRPLLPYGCSYEASCARPGW